MPTGNPWKTLSTRHVYENPWFSVREDEVIRPDGSTGTYSVVELPESVGIVAIDDDRVALVTQWRYVHDKQSLEIPTGGIDVGDASVEAAARRELTEETGLAATALEFIGSIDNSNGATTDVAHMFVARELSAVTKPTQADEQTELVWVRFDEAIEMVLSGAITESTTVAALLKVALLRQLHRLSA
jgi:8-oxo-dGTP pyrophosphatase MutT (NUDIX family)